jgi:hypothetical protein
MMPLCTRPCALNGPAIKRKELPHAIPIAARGVQITAVERPVTGLWYAAAVSASLALLASPATRGGALKVLRWPFAPC